MSLECTMCDVNDSVFFSLLPYGAVSLGAACGGTYIALTAGATGATVAAVAGVALAIIGSIVFVEVTIGDLPTSFGKILQSATLSFVTSIAISSCVALLKN